MSLFVSLFLLLHLSLPTHLPHTCPPSLPPSFVWSFSVSLLPPAFRVFLSLCPLQLRFCVPLSTESILFEHSCTHPAPVLPHFFAVCCFAHKHTCALVSYLHHFVSHYHPLFLSLSPVITALFEYLLSLSLCILSLFFASCVHSTPRTLSCTDGNVRLCVS